MAFSGLASVLAAAPAAYADLPAQAGAAAEAAPAIDMFGEPSLQPAPPAGMPLRQSGTPAATGSPAPSVGIVGCGGDPRGCAPGVADLGTPSPRLAEAADTLQLDAQGRLVLPDAPDAAPAPQPRRPRRRMPAAFSINLPLLMDSRYLGDVRVRVEGERIRVDAASMIELLRADLTDGSIAALEAATQDELLEIGAFAVEGVEIAYDGAEQQIAVTTPLDMRERLAISLRGQALPPTTEIIDPADFSLFVTPRVNLSYNWDEAGAGGRGFAPLSGTVLVGGRILGERGVAFESRQGFSQRRGFADGQSEQSGFALQRLSSSLIYDLPGRHIRARLGDLSPRATDFQSAPRMAGLSIGRRFELEPGYNLRPVGSSEFELERPSSVDVVVNGVVQRRILLRPGRFSIDDLPLTNGGNLVELVVRDDLGQISTLSSRSFFDGGLLRPGLMDFAAQVGVKTITESGRPSYSDEIAASGFVRRGMTPSLTMGANAQGDASGFNAGLSASWANPLGLVDVSLAYSDYKEFGAGQAGSLIYRVQRTPRRGGNARIGRLRDGSIPGPQFGADGTPLRSRLGAGDVPRWWDGLALSSTLSAQYFSANFSTLDSASRAPVIPLDLVDPDAPVVAPDTGLGIGVGPTTTLLSGNGGLGTGRQPFSMRMSAVAQASMDRATVSLSAAHNVGRGRIGDSTSLTAGIDYRMASNLSGGVFARHAQSEDRSDTGLFFSLSWRMSPREDVRASFDTSTNNLTAQYSRATDRPVGGLSYNAAVTSNFDTQSHSVGGNAYYVGNRFEAGLDHAVLMDAGGGGTTQVSRLSAGASLVFADGAIGVSRPVGSSFAVVRPHKSLRGRTVVLDPSADGARARSDFLGPAVDPRAGQLSVSTTSYDIEDLPPGYDIGEGQYATKAPLYAGYKVEIGSDRAYTLVASLVDAEGAPVPYIGGDVIDLDRPDEPPISAFANRNGRLAATGLAPGRYRLKLFNDAGTTVDFEVEADGAPMIELGDIVMETDE